MKRGIPLLLAFLCGSMIAEAQTTIYWKRDTVYAGPGGGAIAIMTPPTSDTTAPSAPTSLSSTSTLAKSVSLQWTQPSGTCNTDFVGFKVYRQKGSGANLPVGTVPCSTSSSTRTFVDQPLEPSTSYTYTVVAFDDAQNHSSASSSINPTTPSSSTDTTPPDPPPNLRGVPTTRASTYKVRLDWDTAADTGSGVAGYKVYRGTTLISGSTPITNRYYEDSTGTANTTYTYKVLAVDGASNESGYSNTVSVTTLRTLIFADNFNRADESSAYGYLRVYNNTLQQMAHSGISDYSHWPAYSTSTFLGSVSVLSRNTNTSSGLVFWSNGTGLYRVAVSDANPPRIYLTYEASDDGDNWVSSTNLPSGPGKLTVDANSTTRRIKIYWNDTLQLDVTDTNTSRSNSGDFLLWDWGGRLCRV